MSLINQCLQRTPFSQFSNLLYQSVKDEHTIAYRYESNLLTMSVSQLPGLTEGQTLLKFRAEHTDAICRAAIACEIEMVQTTCGSVEYVPFTPAKLLPLRMLNERLQQG